MRPCAYPSFELKFLCAFIMSARPTFAVQMQVRVQYQPEDATTEAPAFLCIFQFSDKRLGRLTVIWPSRPKLGTAVGMDGRTMPKAPIALLLSSLILAPISNTEMPSTALTSYMPSHFMQACA